MKIKIIDLLNMKSDFKKMPKKICYDKRLWLLANDGIDYWLEDKIDEIWLFQDYIPNNFDLLCALNDEVEIIEEEKEIEKLGKIYDGFTDSYYDTCLETTIKKVDEIIDVVNKLKKELEKENR